MTSSSLALPRLVRRTMILVISKINYHIFSPLDQHRSGNDPHHPRCPRYVINGSALSTRTSCHLPRGLLFNLLHNGLLWSHIITLSSSLTWQKHDAQRNDRKIEDYVALPHWTVLMYSCPNTSHFWCFLLGLLSREFQNHRVPVLIWKSSFLVSCKSITTPFDVSTNLFLKQNPVNSWSELGNKIVFLDHYISRVPAGRTPRTVIVWLPWGPTSFIVLGTLITSFLSQLTLLSRRQPGVYDDSFRKSFCISYDAHDVESQNTSSSTTFSEKYCANFVWWTWGSLQS